MLLEKNKIGDKTMNEKQKMLAGELYNANYDENLIKERIKAKEICHIYNKLKPSNIKKRENLIKKLFGVTGKQFFIEQDFWCDYGYNIFIGENFYMNHNCVILDCAKVEFGDNVFIAPNCSFYTAGHPIDVEARNKGLEFAKPIKVGNNVWIGGNVTVLPGVTIGNNVTIGAGSLVTKDIPDNVIAYGNPCRVIKNIDEVK